MKTINLLDERSGGPAATSGEPNPLTEDNAFQETTLLDFSYYFIGSTMGILLDLRTSGNLEWPDTGVIVCRGTTQCSWRGVEKPDRYILTVAGSRVRSVPGAHILTLTTWPDPGNTLQIRSRSLEFHAGLCQEVPDLPSNLTDPGPVRADFRTDRWLMEIDIQETYEMGLPISVD